VSRAPFSTVPAGSRPGVTAVRRAREMTRNARLLMQASAQHLADDPVLFAVQVSRRMPFPVRVKLGLLLEQATGVAPGLGAMGSLMAGHHQAAEDALEDAASAHGSSRLAGEVAVLLDRPDLLTPLSPVTTRARALWTRGDLSGAVELLERSEAADSRYARRLRSEVRLLRPGYRVCPPGRDFSARTADPRDGRSLRVLHILTNSLPHTQSGYSLRSQRVLQALEHDGVESVALTRTGYPVMIGVLTAEDEDVVDGVRYVRTLPHVLPQTQTERLEHEVERAMLLAEEFRPDVIHATTNYLNALVAQAVARQTGLPWVLEVRGLMEQTWVASHGSEAGRRVAQTSEKARLIARREAELASRADAVVTLSHTMADELIARGVEAASITLVPNGIDPALLEDHVDVGAAREMIGLVASGIVPAGAFLLGAASALVDYEGFDVLLQAVALVAADDTLPDPVRDRIHVILVGDGTARPGLVALASELGILDRVHFPGRVPRNSARRWVEALDVVVVPRLDLAVSRLVTPQKPIEALALGRPVIASDLPALREVLTSSDGAPCARFAKPGSAGDLARAIVDALTDEASSAAQASRGREVARSRSWAEQVRRYRAVYEQVLKNGGGGGVDAE